MLKKRFIQTIIFTGYLVFHQNALSQDIEPGQFDPLEKSWPTAAIPETWPDPVDDTRNYLYMQFDRLEAGFDNGVETYTWDLQGWYGNDHNKLWMKSEGEGTFHEAPEEFEVQVLYSRILSPFWDIQTGLRHDFQPDPERTYAVLGFQGQAPYFLEVDAAGFMSEKGDILLRTEFEYELLLTQKIILQPRFEINLSAQHIPELELGSGVNSTETGLRLRYEIKREFAPYIGLSWQYHYGQTARYLRDAGEGRSNLQFILGLRMWY